MNYRHFPHSLKSLTPILFGIQTFVAFSAPQAGQKIVLDGSTEAADGFSYLNRNNNNFNLKCDSQKLKNATVFTVVDAGAGRVAFWSDQFGAYLSSEGSQKSMTLNAQSIGQDEAFTIKALEDDLIAIEGSNDRFISTRSGASSIRCSKTLLTRTAHFKWELIEDAETQAAVADKAVVDTEVAPKSSSSEDFNYDSIERSTVGKGSYKNTYKVSSASQFSKLKDLKAGDRVIIEDGTYDNVDVTIECEGSSSQPVEVYAKNPGKVRFTGGTRLILKGENAILSGLRFDGDGGPIEKNGIIQFAKKSKKITLENTLFNNFDHNGVKDAYWMLVYGYEHTVKYCSFQHKESENVTIFIKPGEGEDTQSIPRKHRFTHNYFGPRETIGRNGYEIIRVGDSSKQGFRTECIIENNYFFQAIKTDNWLYEPEIISDKCAGNVYRGNVFEDCDGGIVLRHGQDGIVEENYFIGTGKETEAGIRIIGSGNQVKNNYLENLGGYGWRGAIVLMDGRYGVYDNTYEGIEDAVVSGNVVKNCRESLNIGCNEEEFNMFHNPQVRYDDAPAGVELSDNCFYNDLNDPIFTIEPDVAFANVSRNTVYSKTQNYGDVSLVSDGLGYQAMGNDSCGVPFQRVIEHPAQTGDSYSMTNAVTAPAPKADKAIEEVSNSNSSQDDGAFRVEDGYVLIDAEDFDDSRQNKDSIKWMKREDFIEVGSASMQKSSTSGAEVSYDIYFPKAETFYFHPRNRADSSSADSLYFGIEGSALATCHTGATNGYQWDNNESEAIVIPEPGVYRFIIRRREGGMKLDQFILTTDSGAKY